MDERKNNIRELEVKKAADAEAMNRLLEGLGETIINRIGENEPFSEHSEASAGAALQEYRHLQNELSESGKMIEALEAETLKLKELEDEISAKEGGFSRFEKELEEVSAILGKMLYIDPDFDDITGTYKQQIDSLFTRIDEQEKKMEGLEAPGGGLLSWLGKNTKMAVSKTLLTRNRYALQRLYRNIGEKFLSMEMEPEKVSDRETSETLTKARELKEQIESLSAELSALKSDRRKITDLFGAEGSPSRRITGLKKRIAHVKGEFPKVYLKFGLLAAESQAASQVKNQTEKSGWAAELASFINGNDTKIFKKAELLKSKIAESELGIEKINTAISIDRKKAEIEKLKQAIEGQKQKITFAEEAVAGYEKQIAQSELQIEELEEFLKQNK